MTDPQEIDPDLDTLTRAQLHELPRPAGDVADVLDEWLHRAHGITSSAHNTGLFLELLADKGYRVEPIQAPDLSELSPKRRGVTNNLVSGTVTGTVIQTGGAVYGDVRL